MASTLTTMGAGFFSRGGARSTGLEADFERAPYAKHDKFGEASPENLNRVLLSYGFHEVVKNSCPFVSIRG